jgi:hypothetical protein
MLHFSFSSIENNISCNTFNKPLLISSIVSCSDVFQESDLKNSVLDNVFNPTAIRLGHSGFLSYGA